MHAEVANLLQRKVDEERQYRLFLALLSQSHSQVTRSRRDLVLLFESATLLPLFQTSKVRFAINGEEEEKVLVRVG